MTTFFLLTLYCFTCQPVQIYQIHGIPAFSGGSALWADHYCKHIGDVLSGDFTRRNMDIATPKAKALATKDLIVYSCNKESDWF